MSAEKRMCRACGRDGTARSMYFHSGGVYGECMNVEACERRRKAGDRRSDLRERREHQRWLKEQARASKTATAPQETS